MLVSVLVVENLSIIQWLENVQIPFLEKKMWLILLPYTFTRNRSPLKSLLIDTFWDVCPAQKDCLTLSCPWEL